MAYGRRPLRNWAGRTSEGCSKAEFLSQLYYGYDKNRSPLLSASFMPGSVTVLLLRKEEQSLYGSWRFLLTSP